MRAMTDASEFDPFGGESQEAWPLLRALREASPVATVAGGMPYVTRWAECRAVMRDTTSFSNASGMKAPGVVIPFEDRILGELDPPEHSLVRRVMVTALTPKMVHDAEPFMRATADDLARCALGRRDRRRPRRRVHRAAPEPRHRAPARVPRRGRRSGRADGEGTDGERVPAAEPHRARRRLRQRVPRVRGYIDEQIDAREHALAVGEPAHRCRVPAGRSWRSTVFASPARRRGRSRATSSPVGSRRRASCSATCCTRSSRSPGWTRPRVPMTRCSHARSRRACA